MAASFLRVVYRLACADAGQAARVSGEIALEQTVELPASCVPTSLLDRVVGRVGRIDPIGPGRFEVEIDYDPGLVGAEIPQLFNLLFGNISLKRGIRVNSVEWPDSLLDALPGPRLGIEGLRRLCGVETARPLLCAALKPLGLPLAELAGRCHALAAGGIDIVKDDHGLSDQATAPFDERVARCQEAVERANAENGGRTRYLPNLACGPTVLERRVKRLRGLGIEAVMASPLLVGPDTVRWLSRERGLAVLAHPALAGAYLGDDHGIAPALLLGDLFRLIGSDGVIYPNAGGRFPLSEATCAEINRRLRGPLGDSLPAMPVPGGGIDVESVPGWIGRYGTDVMFLIGGSLYAQGDLRCAAGRLLDSVLRATP